MRSTLMLAPHLVSREIWRRAHAGALAGSLPAVVLGGVGEWLVWAGYLVMAMLSSHLARLDPRQALALYLSGCSALAVLYVRLPDSLIHDHPAGVVLSLLMFVVALASVAGLGLKAVWIPLLALLLLAPRDLTMLILAGSGAAVGTMFGTGAHRTVLRLRCRWNQLEAAARTDDLTKLGNRRALSVDYDAFVAREAGTLGLILWDIDGLKAVNDRDGHGAGDRHILEFVGWLEHYGRRSDTFYRWGGDEFVSLHLLTGDGPGDVDRLHGFVHRVQSAFPAVSAGLIHVREEQITLEHAVAEADVMLYREKRARSGRTGREGAVMAR